MQKNKPSPSTSKKNVFSNFVFHTNHKLKKGFKSSSSVDNKNVEEQQSTKIIKDTCTQTNQKPIHQFKAKTSLRRTHIYKDNGTQTSKTILSLILPEVETGRFSPDSLSPNRDTKRGSKVDADSVSIDESQTAPTDFDYITFNRINNVMQYLESCDKPKIENSELLTGKSLTKNFLEKNRNKQLVYTCETTPNVKIPSSVQTQFDEMLKSKSYVDPPTKNLFANCTEKESPRIIRFKVKNVNEKWPEDKTKPVRSFCLPNIKVKLPDAFSESKSTSSRTKRSFSFMSPTIASENKDQSIEINSIKKLIAPTKRGRSASPKKCIVQKNAENAEPDKIPYIDKGDTPLESILDVTKSDELINEEKYTDMEENMLHLDLKSSNGDVTCTVENSLSATSTDCALFQAIGKLRQKDWNIALRGLAEVVEICRVLDIDCIFPHMTSINQRMIELIKSSRSHVCRTACQAMGHIFEYVKDTRRPEFDELVDSLLCRTADSNKFIRQDANLALDCMVTHMPTFHAVRAICTKGPDHKNQLVRTAAARLIVCAVVLAGPQNVLHPHSNEYTRRRIIFNLVKFLDDKSSETRRFGERLYKLLCRDRIFDIYLKRYLEKDVITKMKKCLKSYNGQKF